MDIDSAPNEWADAVDDAREKTDLPTGKGTLTVKQIDGRDHHTAGTSGVALDGLQADAPGDEYDNFDREWVRLKNVRTDALNLANWTVRDPAEHVYRFENRTLASGATITIVTGDGTDDATRVFQNRGAPVWNNGGDRIIVRNAVGDLVLNVSYDASERVRCHPGVAPVGGVVPIDADCDGRTEDVTGDGQFNIIDVAALLAMV